MGTCEDDKGHGYGSPRGHADPGAGRPSSGCSRGEDDVLAAEWEATVLEHGDLERIAGQPLPKQVSDEPIDKLGYRRPKKVRNPRVARCPKAAT